MHKTSNGLTLFVFSSLVLLGGAVGRAGDGTGGLIDQCRESVTESCHGNSECKKRGFSECDDAVLNRRAAEVPVADPQAAAAIRQQQICNADCLRKEGAYSCLHQCDRPEIKDLQGSCVANCAKREQDKCRQQCDSNQARASRVVRKKLGDDTKGEAQPASRDRSASGRAQ